MAANEPGQPSPLNSTALATPATTDLATPAVGTGDRRTPRRRRVRLRRGARQVGRRRLHRPPPGVHRRLEGHLGSRRRRRGARRPTPGRATRGRSTAGGHRTAARSASWAGSTANSTATSATRGEVARIIRELRPQVVLGHDPWKRYRLHPTTVTPGCWRARASSRHVIPTSSATTASRHHRPEALLLWEADAPDHAEDVSGVRRRQARRVWRPTRASSSRR